MFFQLLKKSATPEDVVLYGTDRIFWALGTVDDGLPDAQNEFMDFEKACKESELWLANGGELLWEHTNKPVGKALEVSEIVYEGNNAVLIKSMIKKGKRFFDAVWRGVQGIDPIIKLNGLSMGGFKTGHSIDCDDRQCRKKWHEFDILEYSLTHDPSKKPAVILGTLQKTANGYEITKDPLPHWQDVYNLGDNNMADKDKKKDKDCPDGDCGDEKDMKKGANGAQAATGEGSTPENQISVLDVEKLQKGIETMIDQKVTSSMKDMTKSIFEQIGSSMTEQFTKMNESITELKKMSDDEDKEKKMEKKDDEDKDKDKDKDKDLEKGNKKGSSEIINFNDFIQVGETPQPPNSNAEVRNNLQKSTKPVKETGWRGVMTRKAIEMTR